jgi:hypothetical protein
MPDITNPGLVTLAIFFIVLIWRFAAGSIEVSAPIYYR